MTQNDTKYLMIPPLKSGMPAKGRLGRDERRNWPNTTRVLIIGLIALSVLVGGCTEIYRPTEYVIGEDSIAGFPIGAPVRIIGEPSPTDDQVIGHIPAHTWVTNYNDVTTTLVAQLAKELTKRGQPVSYSASKTIRLTVLKLGIIGHSPINYEYLMVLLLQLGAAQPKELLINNTFGGGLDGTIASAVIRILSDPKVRVFLGDMPAGNPS